MTTDGFAQALGALHAGDLETATRVCDRLLAAAPKDAPALHLRGLIAMQSGAPAEATGYLQRSVTHGPGDPQAHNNLGLAYQTLGELDPARSHLERACALNPEYPAALNNLGVVYRLLHMPDAAAEVLHRALGLDPDNVGVLCNLGCVAADRGDSQQALEIFERALRIDPVRQEVHRNIALSYKELRRWPEAVEHFQRSGGLRADDPTLCFHMGIALMRLHLFGDAEACFLRAMQQHSAPAALYNVLGALRNQQGRVDEAVEYLEEAIRLDPDDDEAHSNLLLNMHYLPSLSIEALQAAHQRWQERVPCEPRQHGNEVAAQRRIRLGYVSPDFRSHPVGYFVRDLWAHHDREQFEVTAYAHLPFEDDFTGGLKPLVEHWVDCSAMSVDEMATQIHDDQIDILFDLAGHTAGNRLRLFAQKPAPIQITGMGYVNTTGLATMDYVLCDPFHITAADEQLYGERPLRMQHDYICYSPPPYATEVAALPAAATGAITFGNFNNLAKLGDSVAALWSQILEQLPGAQLLMKCHGLSDAATRERVLGLFTTHGIEPQRILLEAGALHADLLASYNRVDLALDPFPYSGGLTTCEALWMGVPVITLRGDRFAGRHSTSHLSNGGLPGFVAETADEYVQIAVQWATDLKALAALRAQLRPKMAASPVCDSEAYTAELETRLRELWSGWCSAQPTAIPAAASS
jgi:predicted O-linked N-acetylglucosamine transferase (SPINDLY family)